MAGFCFYWSIGQVIPKVPPTESHRPVSKPAQVLGCQRLELIKKNDFLPGFVGYPIRGGQANAEDEGSGVGSQLRSHWHEPRKTGISGYLLANFLPGFLR